MFQGELNRSHSECFRSNKLRVTKEVHTSGFQAISRYTSSAIITITNR